MQLRHYGQCLVGISYIHLKQVEFLYSDCNEAFSKARLILVRKRKVDLDPSKEKGRDRDITLPDKTNDEQLIIDLNANNLSQVILMDDNISEVGSLLGTVSNISGDNTDPNLALDHEITMQQNELTISPSSRRRGINNDRRSSFGNISALDLGNYDIEIEFPDDEDNQNDNVLDESQAKREGISHLASLTDIDTDDDNGSVEQGRGTNNNITLLQQDNVSMDGSMDNNQISVLDNGMDNDNGSHLSLQKEKEALNIDDLASVNSGSVDNVVDVDIDIDANIMDIDEDNQSLHVQFDENVDGHSVAGSVSTAALIDNEEATPPPPSPSAGRDRDKNKNKNKNKNRNRNRINNDKQNKKTTLNKTKRKKKKKNKKKFAKDKKIELDNTELRETNPDNFNFVHPGGRDTVHIWREYPLSTLNFDDLLFQPLSKQDFGKFPEEICKKFEECNKKRIIERRKDKSQSADTDIDELADPNILREDVLDIEQGRNDNLDNDQMQHLTLPMNDSMMDNDININNNFDDNDQHSGINEPSFDIDLNPNDDNASTLDSVVDDNIEPNDPLFDADLSELEMPSINKDKGEEKDNDDNDDDDDIKIEDKENNMSDSNRLSFDSGDQNKLTQTDRGEIGGMIKARDWSKRAQKTFAYFKNKEEEEFSFNELMKSQTKRETVVGIFYELLVFKNSGLVELEQDEPYGDITISKTNNFYQHAQLSQKFAKRLSQLQASQQQK